MIATQPVRYRPMTADEVLAELKVYYRGEAFSDADLQKYVSLEFSLLELWQYMDWDSDLGDLISHHGLSLPDDEWFAGVSSKHTVRDFCEAVAVVNEVPVLESATVLGTPCDTAGAFLTLKRMLADAGANVGELAPSSEVLPYLRAKPDVFGKFRLATAGRLRPFGAAVPLSCLLGLLPAVAGGLLAWKAAAGWVALFALGVGLIAYGLARPDYANGLRRRGITTFRDLIRAALGRPARAAA